MVDSRHGILPEQLFLRDFGAEVAHARAHVAMGQLEPSAGKDVRELFGVLQEAARNLFVRRIEAQRQIGGEHRRAVLLRSVVGIGDGGFGAFRDPLLRAGRALAQLPIVFEQVLEEMIAPLGRCLRPRDLETARDGVRAATGRESAHPAQALMFELAALGIDTDVFGVARAMRFAKGVATGDQGHGFFVVHRHAREGLADVVSGQRGIGVTIRPLRIHVNQAHLYGRERMRQLAVA